jgi:hypothetical protein
MVLVTATLVSKKENTFERRQGTANNVEASSKASVTVAKEAPTVRRTVINKPIETM